MEPKQTSEVFQQEIAELEAKLAAKKQELLQSGIEKAEPHIFKEVIKEHAFASETPAVAIPVATPSTKTATTPAVSDSDTAKVNALIAHAFTNGIAAAVSEARKSNDPFLIDALHDRLADEYYQKLLAARKINGS